MSEYHAFDTYNPKYKILRKAISEALHDQQTEYTKKLDAIAEKKGKRLLAES